MPANPAQIRTQPKPQCLFCGTTGVTLHEGLRDRLFGAPGLWRLVRCPQIHCALVWPDPAPLKEDLPLAYRNYYTHEVKAGFVGRVLYPLIAGAYQIGKYVPTVVVGLRRPRQRILSMFLDDLQPGKLFDAGCGDGSFLQAMKRQGWRGGGMDFDAAAVAAGKERYGLDLLVGDFVTAELDEHDFDAVTMSHVIEHVPDPIAAMSKCRKLLRPGGRLVITTPNAHSLGHTRFGPHWRGLEPPRHLQIFSPPTLAECARRAGLEVEEAGSTAANADYVSAASLAIAQAREGEPVGGGWKLNTALPGMIFQYREHFALRKNPLAGEEAFLICRRPRS
jgi:2-polyprenyl-3-methyl-5-hydroxy-6-metoxy-1,4-benzoquinol methylase